ncbi:MAG: endolytic transglycosylase MltG [Terracidiphilus sp.]
MARRRRTSRRRRRSGAGWSWLAVLLVLALAAGGAAAWVLLVPFGPSREIFVELTPGEGTAAIGRQLEAAGVVRSQFAFDLVRWLRRGTLRAGEYRFDHPATVLEVYARIARGDVFTRAVTIPEGENLFEIAARLEQAGFGSRNDFLEAAAKEAGLVADLDPGAASLEGYLFPDTYRFARKATPAQVCAAMVRRFRAAAAQLGLKGNVHTVVTMASLVEKETAVDAERPLVASVFTNRLARKMPLMTDPSVIYGLELEGRWHGTIHQSDLERDTPYNSYLHAGLPPGPVANPGLRSLRAAMDPAKTDYLYFVAAGADPQGRSRFSISMEEHEQNVADYRKAVKKAGKR